MRHESTSLRWGLPVFFGAFLVMLGVVAIAIPIATTVGISWALGLLLVVSGAAQLIQAFRFPSTRGWVSRFLLATISIVAGIIVVRNPIAGAIGMTLALGFYLLVNAVGRGLLALEFKEISGRGWLVFSSLISFCLGVYVIATFPISSLIVPGTLFGVDLIFYGFSTVTLARGLHKTEIELETQWPRKKAA
jgi:uncharacterized membrane protein HdeD (DUF308 family)